MPMVVIMVMIMAAAVAVFIVMMMLVFMVMIMVFMIVMMIMVVAAAVAVFIVMMMVVVMVMIVVFMVMIVMLMGFRLKLCQLLFQGILLLDGFQKLLTGQFIPVSGYDRRLFIIFAYKGDTIVQFFLCQAFRMAENYCPCMFNLIIVKLSEVLHIHLCFLCIYNSNSSV